MSACKAWTATEATQLRLSSPWNFYSVQHPVQGYIIFYGFHTHAVPQMNVSIGFEFIIKSQKKNRSQFFQPSDSKVRCQPDHSSKNEYGTGKLLQCEE